MKSLTWIFILLLGQFLSAQELTIIIVDDETSAPLIGANVLLSYDSNMQSATTDVDGKLVVEDASGIKSILVSYLGYTDFKWEGLYKGEALQEIRLIINESNIAVNPIIIANPFLSSDVVFKRKEFQILPGAYEDPARLLLKAPGFSTGNDQANAILYRGFPSNFINWNINGALIVNPNHLSNAGTLSDLSSANAGGVNMLSGQVIGKYDFQSAPNRLPGNNSITGNSNIEFTDFNNTYLNLSLVGLEAGYGFKGKKLPGAQFNYRYSTVGILTGVFGLDFGGEEIVYQDLFSKFDFIDKADEKLSGYLALGINHNYKDSIVLREEAETFKDVQQVNYDSRLLLSGLKYWKKWSVYDLNVALNYSTKNDSRSSLSSLPALKSNAVFEQRILGGIAEVRVGNFKTGINFSYLHDLRSSEKSIGRKTKISMKTHDNFNFMPFANYEVQGLWYYLSGGSGITYNTLTNNIILEPYLKASAILSNSIDIEMSYRRNSQLLPGSNFSYDFAPNEIIGNHLETFLKFKDNKLSGFISGYYHLMNGILIEGDSYYSQFTGTDNPELIIYNYDGKAAITGISLGFSTKNLVLNNLNLSGNASFFSSRYTSGLEGWVSNTFAFNESYNFLASYQRKLSKDREWITSFSAHVRGGLNEFKIDQERSADQLEVIYDFSHSPVEKLLGYNRLDFRFVYNLRKGKNRKYAKSFSLDIQNLSNIENDAYSNYDFLNGERFVQKQLGLIPILAYRIEF